MQPPKASKQLIKASIRLIETSVRLPKALEQLIKTSVRLAEPSTRLIEASARLLIRLPEMAQTIVSLDCVLGQYQDSLMETFEREQRMQAILARIKVCYPHPSCATFILSCFQTGCTDCSRSYVLKTVILPDNYRSRTWWMSSRILKPIPMSRKSVPLSPLHMSRPYLRPSAGILRQSFA